MKDLELQVNEASKALLTPEQLLLKMVEECSELSAGICKYLNKPNIEPETYLEEVVDVQLLIDQLRFTYPELVSKLDELKEQKLRKILPRLKRGER